MAQLTLPCKASSMDTDARGVMHEGQSVELSYMRAFCVAFHSLLIHAIVQCAQPILLWKILDDIDAKDASSDRMHGYHSLLDECVRWNRSLIESTAQWYWCNEVF